MRTTVDGRAVCYGTGGATGQGQPIVFVHGAGFNHSVWVMQARYFARHGYRVLAPDLPAHGGSQGPALTRIEDMADWLADFLRSIQVTGVVAVGHSLGSLVVTSLAQRHQELVDKLALLGTSDPMQVGPPLLKAAEEDDPAAFAMANTWSHSASGAMGSAAVPGMSNLVSGARWLERMDPGVYYADLNACNEYTMEAARIEHQTLVVIGTDDKMTNQRAGLKLALEMPNTQSVVLPGCGHAMMSERPNEVLDALAAFTQSSN